MKSPKLYAVLNFKVEELFLNDGYLFLDREQIEEHKKLQQDNLLFRQIRLISGDNGKFNEYLVFVECDRVKQSNSTERADKLREIINNGFYINQKKFVICESSSSMTRNAILSFIDNRIKDKIDEVIKMGNFVEETVVNKYRAYRGLMLSSCFVLERYTPKIIVTAEAERVIKGISIRYLTDEECDFTNDEGELVKYKKKVIKDDVRDITENCFDGCGIMHPQVAERISAELGLGADFNSCIIRLPYIKGCVHKIDYTEFFRERGVDTITDIWGVEHSIYEPMIIVDESMYKGYKYFKKYDDYRDWEYYWEMFEKYNHRMGIAKYNFSSEDEKYYTRGNYQILQDLDLDYSDFKHLGDVTADYFENVMDGKLEYMLSFLGLVGGTNKAVNNYMRAVEKDYRLLGEEGVRNNIKNLLKGYMDDSKAGKIWLKGCFKFAVPDLIAFMEHVGGLEMVGCLKEQQMWTKGKIGYVAGKQYLITRNPHITSSEHDVVSMFTSDEIEKYIGHLQNVCMVDMYSPHMNRLNGMDFDGDILFVLDEPLMIKGVHMDIPMVMDVDDKITIAPAEYNEKNICDLILHNLDNRIGEYSNYATCYHNKMKKTEKTKKIHDDYVAVLSVMTGKEIDAAKCGVRFNLPRQISKYARPLPYFMKFAGEYYSKLHEFNKYRSNMNSLCFDIERWENTKKNRKYVKDFDYHLMIDENCPFNEENFNKVSEVYEDFNKTIRRLLLERSKCQNYEKNKDWIKKYMKINKKQAICFDVDWNYYYDSYRKKLLDITSNKAELVNYLVILCYEKHPRSSKKIIWSVAGDWVANNIKAVNKEILVRDVNGDINILGDKYKWESVE